MVRHWSSAPNHRSQIPSLKQDGRAGSCLQVHWYPKAVIASILVMNGPPPEKPDQPKLERFATLQPSNKGGDMKKSKFSEEQIVVALRQVDAGAPIPEVTRRLGISEATYYVWCNATARWPWRRSVGCGSSKTRAAS
jgi:transposase